MIASAIVELGDRSPTPLVPRGFSWFTLASAITLVTAAGPAFEGMNISQGMRAAPGAVESFQLQNDGSHLLATIDNQPPIGICGSGLLDIVGQLVQHRLKLLPLGQTIAKQAKKRAGCSYLVATNRTASCCC